MIFIGWGYPPTKMGESEYQAQPSMCKKMASVVLELRKLLSKYSKHQVDWYDIGLQLGIKKYALDIIKYDYPNKAGDCFWEMLAY